MYQKYHSDTFVIRGYERGEADRVFALYTKEFGFIWARASSVRRESSRMRYALQSGTRARTSLVRGSRGWRIVGASAESIPIENVSAARAFGRVTTLLERLAGEEANHYLFDALTEAYVAFTRDGSTHYAVIELIVVARMLYALGYLSAEAVGTALFTHTQLSYTEFEEALRSQQKILSSVNKALGETHL